jgi:hypothetical protein
MAFKLRIFTSRQLVLLFCLAVLAGLPAGATTFTFEGLVDSTAVPSGFYSASGISSISGATSFVATSAGGSVPFGNMPSANTAIQASAAGAIFNVPGGFTSSATVWYSANGSFNRVDVYSGLDATGLLASSASFVDNRSNCHAGANPGDPGCWTLATVTWSGSAQSIRLGGNAGTFYFDNLVLNVTDTAVPEPGTAGLMMLALAGLGLARLRRGRRA